MTISDHIKSQYFSNEEQLIRLAPSQPPPLKPTKRKGTPWTDEEHNRFLEALEKYPAGPWKHIAEHVRTRTTRQTMTHAQRYREKIARRKRILAGTELAVDSHPSSPAHSHQRSRSPTHLERDTAAAVDMAGPSLVAASTHRLRPSLGDDSESDDEDDDDNGTVDEIKIDDQGDEINSYVSRDSNDGNAASGSPSTSALLATADSLNVAELEDDFEDIEDEQLLLSLVEAFEPLPFSAEEAHWLTEHYSAVSL